MQALEMKKNTEDSPSDLPMRWFNLPAQVKSHPIIQKFLNDNKRFKTCHAGRRSFKTEIAKRTLIYACFKIADEAFFCGAPTRDQAKRIFWEDVKKLSPKWFIKDVAETELRIRYKNDSELWVIGFDKPERFEGKRWKGGVLTEFPHFKPNAWDETIMPALRDTHGWAIIEGVPEGGGDKYQELCDYAKSGKDPEWADYSWKSIDVMDPREIEKERGRLDERTFRQEYEGSFENYQGRAYCYYESDIHSVGRNLTDSPVVICCDFNINPCIWEFVQDDKEFTYVFHELRQAQTDIWKMCAGAKLYLESILRDARKHKLRFYGDYTSAKQRDVSAVASSWEIIRNEFAGWNAEFRLKSNPRIVDRVNAVNSRMRSADGHIHFGHSADCIELKKDFERVDMEMLTTSKQEAGDRTHASDALGYFINYEYPVIANKSYYL